MASLAAAWTLANSDSPPEITVYQLGWRLGGKGASGRNAEAGDRIEEHGLHIWFGCYQNAFRILRECYQGAGQATGAPFTSIEDAFQPQDRTPIGEFVDGVWRLWPITYPQNDDIPGASTNVSIWQNIKNLLIFVDQMFDDWQEKAKVGVPTTPRKKLERLFSTPSEAQSSDPVLHQCRRLAEAARADPTRPYRRGVFGLVDGLQTWRYRRAILARLRQFRNWANGTVDPTALDDEIRRTWITIDLAVTAVLGCLVDGALLCGLESLDGEDLRAWLRRHGAQHTTVWSGIVRAQYDLVFAYEDGETGDGTPANPGKPNFAAGTALEVILRIVFTYSGAVCYQMRAGMGEVVFAPMYKALKKKGVKFAFFHRVKRLELAPDGRSVAKIQIGQQVRIRNQCYDPLVTINGLECWPSKPDLKQIVDGDQAEGIDLESYWSGWTDVEELILEADKDFDDIILGISLGALSEICTDLAHRKRRWRNMLRYVKTVQTQSAQLWMNQDLESLGWNRGSVPVDAGPEPLDVWQDMSHLLPRESWPGPTRPHSIQYLCGPLSGDFASRPGADTSVPEEARRSVRSTAVSWLRKNAQYFWPDAIAGGLDEFNWDSLYDPVDRPGEQRLDFQYLRANIEPSERYVLSVAGSTRHRMRPHETGCRNLFVAGDWTYTSYNAGCIEAAAISGIDAAEALLGRRDGSFSLLGFLLGTVKLIARLLCRILITLGIFGRRMLHVRRSEGGGNAEVG